MLMRSLVLTALLLSGLMAGPRETRGAPAPDPALARPALQKIHPSLRRPGQIANVLVRLQDPPLIAKLGRNAKQLGFKLTRDEQIAYARQLRRKQSEVSAVLKAGGGQLVAHLTASQNAVLAVVNTDVLPAVSDLATVLAIRPVLDSEIELAGTVPRIGASTLHATGVTGEGVRIAVLDSGIDYTHRHFGGTGTLEAYAAAYGASPADPSNTVRGGLFPTPKVIGGWDFVGEVWPLGPGGSGAPIQPDEDPIDYGGHGTHVADILAGASLDGTHQGVAPGATLYAFKVCSAVSTGCNGFSILLGLDACLHPKNPEWSLLLEEDGDLLSIVEDEVDVINLSLGSGYGQIQDDKAYVVQLFSDFGITVVTAAGNDGDRPYILDSPSVAPGSISVAETQVPGAKAFSIRTSVVNNRGGVTTLQTILNTADIAWAPVDRPVQATAVAVGFGCATDAYPIPVSEVAGKILVIDRGRCDISEKVDRAARSGAIGVILVNSTPGDPPTFSQGAGSQFVPTLVVTPTEGAALKAFLVRSPKAQTAFGPSSFTSLANSMVSTSSRGPNYTFQTIKPELGAPGASISAEAGTGWGAIPFGGTSGATPVVAGAVALLQSASLATSGLHLAPWAIKALLMNNAEAAILVNPASQPGLLAPITRIGAGEVRVDRALAAEAFAVVVEPPIEDGAPPDIQPALSFGYHAVIQPGPWTVTKEVEVVNLSTRPRTFSLSHSFRYADDQASGAVTIGFSSPTVDVPPEGQGSVTVTLTLDPTRLSSWTLNGGAQGGNGALLRQLEFDGHIRIADDTDVLSLPWHILPRKAADLVASPENVGEGGTIQLSNLQGAVPGVTEVFALGGTSPLDWPKPDPFGINIAFPDLYSVGIRAVDAHLEIAFAFHHEWSHPVTPFGCAAYLDLNHDGLEDLEFFTTEATGYGVAEVVVVDFFSGDLLGIFPVDADLNASVMVTRVPLGLLGLNATSTVDWYALVWDNYFTGSVTDGIPTENLEGSASDPIVFLRHKLDQPRYLIPGSPTKGVAPGASVSVKVLRVPGGEVASPSQEGFLLFHRQAQPGRGAQAVRVDAAAAVE